jgi:hypothetical protein
MLEKMSISLLLFFNTITSSVDPKNNSEQKIVNQINKEIKTLERKIEMIQITDDDFASRTVRTNRITDEITDLKGKIVKIEKVAKLKEKWASEDSLSKSKK